MAKTTTTKTTITKTTTAKKKRARKKKAAPRKKRSTVSNSPTRVQSLLVENFVSLQKAITNMTEHFSSLSKRIENLLSLFEISAKSIAQKDFNQEEQEKSQKDLLKKIDAIIEQNKVIARGLALLHSEPVEKEVHWEHQEKAFKRPPVTTGYKISQNPPVRQMTPPTKPAVNKPQNTTRMQGFEPS